MEDGLGEVRGAGQGGQQHHGHHRVRALQTGLQQEQRDSHRQHAQQEHVGRLGHPPATRAADRHQECPTAQVGEVEAVGGHVHGVDAAPPQLG
ncbi:hypothetical protein CP976_34065 [Streptomyces coeruleorubidus]|uniref:Uncharacterized protein n=1 Tax=Streptomyces coeruleorubidus TaxID=116188 RepID=A0A5J6IAG3_STRC4|nr:hypothetical protein CP976_34065 [Streptomyces coeruleorubidus]